jgi:hypothetical protein
MAQPFKENPWDWLEPPDVRRFGEVVLDPAERARWCRATLICGLPFMWKTKAGPFRALMYEKLGLRQGDKVLLLGESIESCGFEDEIRAAIGPTGEIRAIDIMETARTTSAAGIRGRGGRVGTWRYDYTADVADGYFDCVAVIQAVQHADDWAECARELLRVMKQGRAIVLAEIGVSRRTRELAVEDMHLEYWMEKLYYGTGRRGPEDVSYYSPAELAAAFGGLVTDSGTHSWRGADMFWGVKV